MKSRFILFTVHKAASLGVHDILRRIASKERWDFYSPNLKTPNLTEPAGTGDADFHRQLAGKSGLIGPVRMPVFLPDAMKAADRFALHLRDPRDVLVSMYYSWSYSHPGVSGAVRERYREMGVDQCALFESPQLMEKYSYYMREILPLPRTTLLRYEDFVLDRERWLHQLLGALGLGGKHGSYKPLARDNPAANLKGEDKTRHLRKALPGDFREKLAPATIDQLNEQWGDILGALDYSI